MSERINCDFFKKDALEIAHQLLGMKLVRRFKDNRMLTLDITDIEVYRGEDDLGCHASKGRTPRTEIMYLEGGKIYVYLIYGMYWLLNLTTGPENHPQAILIRGTRQVEGPGRIGKKLELDKTFYGESIIDSERLWISPPERVIGNIITLPRVGIDYAGTHWANINWRFMLKP